MIELTSKQRKFLEKKAHGLSPVVIVGGAGVTDGLIGKVEESVKAHELIKVKFNEFKEDRQNLTATLCEKTDSTLVRILGNVAVLYRPAEKEEDRVYQTELDKLLK